ncbi:MAG: hypothetical protein KatS3mg124_0227 [Porticoccaceae bacterium]|nr:MAG: hypothetical protein KatS3mg124_0227 [Porticoccaceae bacterium]
MSGLVTPELLAHVGRKSEPRRELVTRRDIRRYAIATGNRERKYLDGEIAPPMFYLALFWPVAEREELLPDGVARDPLLPEFPLKKAMAGGLAIEYFKPIRPGDWLTATRELTAIYEKKGSSGPLIFYEVEMTVVDDAGELVVREKTTRILR